MAIEVTDADFEQTILNSDKIYVVDEGKIIGEGNHKELLEKSLIYKNFYEKQIKKN